MAFKILIFLFTFFMGTLTGVAQLCPGSLGDPIVNINFGNGANPGPPLTAATTSYQFISSDCPNDGFYTVRNNTIGCYGNTWHSLSSDHTGNGGGYFMLVNASFQAGAFYVDTVRGLCGGTTYEFASWILNVLVPSSCNGNTIQPNLTFSIETTNGAVLQSYNSGSIAPTAAALWQQFGFFFTTPPSVADVVLRIVNNAPGGCGNDLLLDDITFRPCGPQISSAINASPTSSVSICQGQSGSFALSNTISGGFMSPAYQWQQLNTLTNTWSDISGATNLSYTVNVTPVTPVGVFQYRLALAEAGNLGTVQCRVFSNPFSIRVDALPITTLSNNGPVCEGQNIVLTATGGSSYLWSGPGGFTSSTSPATLVGATMANSGLYSVDIMNAAGCTKRDSISVSINPAPLAFTSFDSVLICAGESVNLSASGGTSYSWTPTSGLQNAATSDPIAIPTSTTIYQVIVGNQLGCRDTAFAKVVVTPLPIANAGLDKLIFSGQSVLLTGMVSGSLNFQWTPATFIDDPRLLQPLVNPPADAQYVLEVTSSCGIIRDTVEVKVFHDLYIPNAFSPNGDGINDTWNIPAIIAYPEFEVRVYGRWGHLVYYSKNVMLPWDGRFKGIPLPGGAYIYSINLNGKKSLKGSIMLIR